MKAVVSNSRPIDLNSSPRYSDEDMVFDTESISSNKIRVDEGAGIDEELGRLLCKNFIRVDEEDKNHQLVKKKLLSGLEDQGLHHLRNNSRFKAVVHRNVFSTLMSQAKLQCFVNFLKVVMKTNEGCANVKFAWYGGSKDEIKNILKYGFGHSWKNQNFGHGICLSPFERPLLSLQACVADEDELIHLVLCRVILGRTTVVHPDNWVQHCPSSEEFDSGVDNLSSPERYIIWSTHVNTHILPHFLISFSKSSLLDYNGVARIPPPPSPVWRRPSGTPEMPFPTLISEIAKVLPHDTLELLRQHHDDHRQNKIQRQELIWKLRRLVGDDLLARIITSYYSKFHGSSRVLAPINNQQSTPPIGKINKSVSMGLKNKSSTINFNPNILGGQNKRKYLNWTPLEMKISPPPPIGKTNKAVYMGPKNKKSTPNINSNILVGQKKRRYFNSTPLGRKRS